MLSHNKYFRQCIIKYLEKHTVTEASIYFKTSRKTIYKWLHRYDGTLKSLEDRSHRPHNSPKAHTEEEIKQIRRCIKKYKGDILLAYQTMIEKHGYTRSYGGFKRLVLKLRAGEPKKKKHKRSQNHTKEQSILDKRYK